jgi:hypothetical protein
VTFRNMLIFLLSVVFNPTFYFKAAGQSLVGCLRLLIHYNRSYPPCMETLWDKRDRHEVPMRKRDMTDWERFRPLV